MSGLTELRAVRERALDPHRNGLDPACGDGACTEFVAFFNHYGDALTDLVSKAEVFHRTLWHPWRSGRIEAITSDSVTEAYGELRAALARFREPSRA